MSRIRRSYDIKRSEFCFESGRQHHRSRAQGSVEVFQCIVGFEVDDFKLCRSGAITAGQWRRGKVVRGSQKCRAIFHSCRTTARAYKFRNDTKLFVEIKRRTVHRYIYLRYVHYFFRLNCLNIFDPCYWLNFICTESNNSLNERDDPSTMIFDAKDIASEPSSAMKTTSNPNSNCPR